MSGWVESDPDTLKLKRPRMRWKKDALLALHEAHGMLATGRKEVRPIEIVSEIDIAWERSVYTEYAHLEWLRDYYTGLSPEDRASLERIKDEVEEESAE